jgi:hypothetical protein
MPRQFKCTDDPRRHSGSLQFAVRVDHKKSLALLEDNPATRKLVVFMPSDRVGQTTLGEPRRPEPLPSFPHLAMPLRVGEEIAVVLGRGE